MQYCFCVSTNSCLINKTWWLKRSEALLGKKLFTWMLPQLGSPQLHRSHAFKKVKFCGERSTSFIASWKWRRRQRGGHRSHVESKVVQNLIKIRGFSNQFNSILELCPLTNRATNPWQQDWGPPCGPMGIGNARQGKKEDLHILNWNGWSQHLEGKAN